MAADGPTSPMDPLADREMYSTVFFRHNPPVMQHDFRDHSRMKCAEALPLNRIRG